MEIYFGGLNAEDQITNGEPAEMSVQSNLGDGVHRFAGSIRCDQTGQHGFTIRVIPSHPDLAQKHETTHITWA